MTSSQICSLSSWFTSFLTRQLYQPMWLRLTLLKVIKLLFLVSTVTRPCWSSFHQKYWIGFVPLFTSHRIQNDEPSTAEDSFRRIKGLETGTATQHEKSLKKLNKCHYTVDSNLILRTGTGLWDIYYWAVILREYKLESATRHTCVVVFCHQVFRWEQHLIVKTVKILSSYFVSSIVILF